MKDEAEIRRILDAAYTCRDALSETDDEIEVMIDTLRFVLGVGEATAEDFINQYIGDEYVRR